MLFFIPHTRRLRLLRIRQHSFQIRHNEVQHPSAGPPSVQIHRGHLQNGRWWLGVACSALGNAGSYTAMALFNLEPSEADAHAQPRTHRDFRTLFLKKK